MPSQFQVDAQRLTHMSDPERAGPVVTVLQNTELLLQCVLPEPAAMDMIPRTLSIGESTCRSPTVHMKHSVADRYVRMSVRL